MISIYGDPSRINSFMTLFHSMDKLQRPYYIVRGNHELGPALTNVFGGHLRGERGCAYYSFPYAVFQFVVLDGCFFRYQEGVTSSWKTDENGCIVKPIQAVIVPEEQLGWVRKILIQSSKNFLFIFHFSARRILHNHTV